MIGTLIFAGTFLLRRLTLRAPGYTKMEALASTKDLTLQSWASNAELEIKSVVLMKTLPGSHILKCEFDN